jgi:hypothetical protein
VSRFLTVRHHRFDNRVFPSLRGVDHIWRLRLLGFGGDLAIMPCQRRYTLSFGHRLLLQLNLGLKFDTADKSAHRPHMPSADVICERHHYVQLDILGLSISLGVQGSKPPHLRFFWLDRRLFCKRPT